MNMEGWDDYENMKIGKQIILQEMNKVVTNHSIIKQNGCAACHVLSKLVDKLQISESDASDLMSEILFHDSNLNDAFVEMQIRSEKARL